MALAGRKVVFLGHVPSVDHVKELHCNAYCYVHGHMLGGTNPALVKALGYGNMILALDTAFNREVIRDYGLYFSKNADDLMARLQYVKITWAWLKSIDGGLRSVYEKPTRGITSLTV